MSPFTNPIQVVGLWLSVVLGTVAISARALAADDKVFDGSLCTFAASGHYNGQDRSYIKLWNSSAQTETVSCPLKRDRAEQSVLEAYIIASAEMDEDTCSLWSREDDFSYASWTHNHVVSTAPGYNKTSFAWGATSLVPDDFASLQLTCEVPDGAGILNYYLYEN